MEGRKSSRLIDAMDARPATLARVSGVVTDKRRFVALLYMLLRDHVAFGVVEEARRDSLSLVATQRIYVLQGHPPVAHLLTSHNRQRVEDFMALLVKRAGIPPTTLLVLAQSLPAADDVETVLTNGWVGKYAQFIADEILG